MTLSWRILQQPCRRGEAESRSPPEMHPGERDENYEHPETYPPHPRTAPKIDVSLTTSQILTQPTQTF